jgi:hypothetical protein
MTEDDMRNSPALSAAARQVGMELSDLHTDALAFLARLVDPMYMMTTATNVEEFYRHISFLVTKAWDGMVRRGDTWNPALHIWIQPQTVLVVHTFPYTPNNCELVHKWVTEITSQPSTRCAISVYEVTITEKLEGVTAPGPTGRIFAEDNKNVRPGQDMLAYAVETAGRRAVMTQRINDDRSLGYLPPFVWADDPTSGVVKMFGEPGGRKTRKNG